MIKRLEINELRNLYQTQIKNDFPRFERRPFHLIRNLHSNGKYLCLVLEEEKQVIAYATFIVDDSISNVLLDYFAVAEKRRGSGIGSRFISLVRDYWSDKSGIIIECESPDTARTEGEKAVRKRRIDFYLRGGAENTTVRWRILGMRYNILWLPTSPNNTQINIAKDLAGLYSLSIPSLLRPLSIRMMANVNNNCGGKMQ